MSFVDEAMEIHPDWLVQILIDRCKERDVVDKEDLALILSLNFEREWQFEFPYSLPFANPDYGTLIRDLGKLVVAKGGVLTVPNLQDYDQAETLKAPPDWLERWGNDDTAPDCYELWRWFDIYSAMTPDGSACIIDGRGAPTAKAWERYINTLDRILEERRLRRNSTRSGKT